MQVDLETSGLHAAFKGFRPRPNYDDRVFSLDALLTERAKRWLEFQTEEERQRFMRECTSNCKHFRSLSYVERDEQRDWIHTRDMSDDEYVKYQQWLQAGIKRLAQQIADDLYNMANRPGFMRRFFEPPKHTVPEATEAEFKLARRIQSRLKPIRPLRAIIQQLHS